MNGERPEHPRGQDVARLTWRVLRARQRPLTLLAGWSLVEALPALLSGYLTARAVDHGFLAGRADTGFAWLGVLGVAIVLGAAATGRVHRKLGAIVEPFRDELAHRVVRASLYDATVFGARPDTAAVARLTHQVEIVRDTFAGLVMVVRGFLFAAGAALLGLLALAPVVAALVAVPLLAAVAVFVAALPSMAERQREYVRADESLGETAALALSGHRDVVACRAQDRLVAQVDARVRAQAAAERATARMAALRSFSIGLGGWAPLVVLLLAASWLARHGLTAGAVLGALVYVSTGLQPALHALVQGVAGGGLRYVVTLERILQTTAGAQPGRPALDRMAAGRTAGEAAPAAERPAPVIGRVPASATRSHVGSPRGQVGALPRPPVDAPPALRLRGLTFRYGPRARPVLDDFHLALPAGDHLAVVGPSGTGKSTLATLAAGLLRPQAGSVHLFGVPVADTPPAVLAGLRVLVPQEAYVFTGTLAANLRYLCPDADDAALADALDALGVTGLAKRLGGLNGAVEPAALSAGERQIIAAARAWLAPAPLVILDEATCHLDPAMEATVEQAFTQRHGTLVVIAHRISSALRARRVLVLDGDCPVVDTHDRLLTRSATYRELVGYWEELPSPDPEAPARTVRVASGLPSERTTAPTPAGVERP